MVEVYFSFILNKKINQRQTFGPVAQWLEQETIISWSGVQIPPGLLL